MLDVLELSLYLRKARVIACQGLELVKITMKFILLCILNS